MKKWTYLVATLFFGATVAFTSCVNTDEPEGIKEMRGAKAELLRAKALVEQAKATSEAAQATLTQAQAEVQKALAEVEKANAEYKRAQTQIEKDKAAVELQRLQAQAESLIAQYEAQAAAQQLAYEETMKKLEALALTLTQEEQNAIGSWKLYADAANTALKNAEGALKTAQGAYYNAVTGNNYISESVQEAKIAKAQLKADQKAKAYAIQEGLLASLKEIAPAEWDEVLRDLQDSIKAAEVAKAATEVAVTEYCRSEEFQAYEQAFLAAIEAQGQYKGIPGEFAADGSYIVAAQGGEKTEFTGTKAALKAARKAYNEAANAVIALDPYKFNANPAVAYFLNHANPQIASQFTIGNNLTWTLAGYLDDVEALAEDENYTGNDKMFKKLQALVKYRNALDKFEIDPNGQEWLKLELPAKEEASLEADTAYMEAVALWQIQAEIVKSGDYSGVDFETAAKGLKELIDGQNAAYTAYAAGVAEYDSMVYVVKKAADEAYNKGVEKVMAEDTAYWLKDRFMRDAYDALPTTAEVTGWALGVPVVSKENWDDQVMRNTYGGSTNKDSLTMATILNLNHANKSTLPNAQNIANKAKEDYAALFTADKKKALMTSTVSYPADAVIGVSAFSVGNWKTAGDAAVGTAMANAKSDLAKAIKKTGEKFALINDATVDGSLLKAYLDYDGNVIKGEFNNFSSEMLSKYGLLTVDTLSDANKFNTLVGYNQFVDASYENSIKAVKSKKTPANDSTVVVANVGTYTILAAVDKSISDEAFATMKEIAGIDQDKAVTCLKTYSNAAFGANYDWTADKARLINEIEEKLLADCQAIVPTDANESAFEAACGAFGKKYWNNYWFEVCSNYQQANDLKQVSVDSLDAQIAVLQAAVETAKTACAEPLAALEAAKADYEAAEAAIKAAKDERDAQMDAQQALVELAEANVNEWEYQKSNLKKAIDGIDSGFGTAEAYLDALDTKLANDKVALEEANEAVVEAQKVLDMIKAGTYSYEFGVQQAESALERAQANYDIAAAEYQAALAKLAEVLATLVGE